MKMKIVSSPGGVAILLAVAALGLSMLIADVTAFVLPSSSLTTQQRMLPSSSAQYVMQSWGNQYQQRQYQQRQTRPPREPLAFQQGNNNYSNQQTYQGNLNRPTSYQSATRTGEIYQGPQQQMYSQEYERPTVASSLARPGKWNRGTGRGIASDQDISIPSIENYYDNQRDGYAGSYYNQRSYNGRSGGSYYSSRYGYNGGRYGGGYGGTGNGMHGSSNRYRNNNNYYSGRYGYNGGRYSGGYGGTTSNGMNGSSNRYGNNINNYYSGSSNRYGNSNYYSNRYGYNGGRYSGGYGGTGGILNGGYSNGGYGGNGFGYNSMYQPTMPYSYGSGDYYRDEYGEGYNRVGTAVPQSVLNSSNMQDQNQVSSNNQFQNQPPAQQQTVTSADQSYNYPVGAQQQATSQAYNNAVEAQPPLDPGQAQNNVRRAIASPDSPAPYVTIQPQGNDSWSLAPNVGSIQITIHSTNNNIDALNTIVELCDVEGRVVQQVNDNGAQKNRSQDGLKSFFVTVPSSARPGYVQVRNEGQNSIEAKVDVLHTVNNMGYGGMSYGGNSMGPGRYGSNGYYGSNNYYNNGGRNYDRYSGQYSGGGYGRYGGYNNYYSNGYYQQSHNNDYYGSYRY